MKRLVTFFRSGNVTSIALIAGAVIALMSVVASQLVGSRTDEGVTDLYLRSERESVIQGNTVDVTIMARSSVPVNVFAGELNFNPDLFYVESISYNTGIADLWVELPWYSNGDGTLNFGGGTTKPGGFIGTGPLITVTFKTKGLGNATLTLHDPRILLHDGLGTDASLGTNLDTIIRIDAETRTERMTLGDGAKTAPIRVVGALPSTDLDSDGKQTLADVSMFMVFLSRQDTRGDFNGDGVVDTQDLSRLLGGG